MRRRHALWYFNAGALLAGCAPARLDTLASLVPPTLRPLPLPRDSAAVFHGLLRDEPVRPLSAPDSPWLTYADPPSTVEAGPGLLRLHSVPDRRVWASPRLPVTPLAVLAQPATLPAPERQGAAAGAAAGAGAPSASAPGPAAAAPVSPDAQPGGPPFAFGPPAGTVEELTWETRLTLHGRFFVVCELRFTGEPGALLVQATPFDLQVFHDPARPQGGTSHSVSRLLHEGMPHYWRLRLASGRTELHLDGSVVWTLDGARSLSRVAFGETRTDELHGGTMELRDVVYVRRPVSNAETRGE
jgi:hypothetical protein